MSAREEILGRVRRALRDVPDNGGPEDVAPEDVGVERGYRRASLPDRQQRLERFVERVEEYRASVRRVASAELAAAIAEACARREVRRLVVPDGVPSAWLPDGVEIVVDRQLPTDALDAVDGALTGCAVAIAETGTIVLDGGDRQGRRAITLVPDYHLCVVEAGQVVGSVPEAVAALAEVARRPLTFISGPSATSDIELDRVEGVHGPRTLDVLLVQDATTAPEEAST